MVEQVMHWEPYRDCCREHAADTDAAFCPVCRHPLLRCHGFAECGQLLEPQQACPVHVAPLLALRRDGLHAPQVGDRMNLPLVLANRSNGSGGLRIARIHRLKRSGELEPVDLQWEKLGPGRQRMFSVETNPLDSGGSIGVRLVLVVAASFDGLDEEYAFIGEVALTVGHEQAGQVIQNIHIEGSHIAAGGSAVLQTGPSVNEAIAPLPAATRAEGMVDVPLERAERFERERGIRGYADAGLQIPRTVELRCDGFPQGDAPAVARPFLLDTRLGFGRNSPSHASAQNPTPNFASLRAYHHGQLMKDLSMRVSRRHFELLLRSGRLYLHTLGHGGSLNGGELEQGETVLLKSGDVFNPLAQGDAQLDCRVDFDSDGRSVAAIHLRRIG